ncbi:MAG: hypothetical protein A2020_05480 [Lentisphaerae bacterium GWF2_45_14]|nr:MAG: hypothetical protein A2020_05480 [Lentisphaerae bacterium GWF2_45_14]
MNFCFMPNIALLIGAAALVINGCHRADPAEAQTKFLPEPTRMRSLDESGPVNKIWKDPQVNIFQYDRIIVMPVRMDEQLERGWMERNNIRHIMDKDKQDFAEFARYTEHAYKDAIYKDKRLTLADRPSPKTLILELALVKIVPGKPIFGGIKNITNFTIIGLILLPLKTAASTSLDNATQASVAMEGIVRDSETRKPIAIFADREKQKTAIFSTRDFTAYGNLRQIADEWAKTFVKMMNKQKAAPPEVFVWFN